MQAEGGPDAKRQREPVPAEQPDPRAHLLPAQTAQHAVADGGQRIEQLETGADEEDAGHEQGDIGVVGEEFRDVVPQRGEDDGVDDSNHAGRVERNDGDRLRQLGLHGTDQICHPGA